MAQAVRMKTLPSLLLLSLCLTASMASGAGALEKAPAPPQWQPLAQVPHTEADTARTLAAAYYSLKSSLSATLMLSNQGPHSMDVRVRLFSLAGEPFDLAPVTLAGNEVRAFKLRDVVPPEPAFEEGSLEVRFQGKNLELGGVLTLTDAARSLLFDEELTEPAAALVSSRLEGVWWSPAPTAAWRLVLANTTDAPLSATVRLDGVAPGQKAPVKVTLDPRETRVLGLSRLLGRPTPSTPRSGGVSVTQTGAGGLLARIFIEERTLGYSDAADLSDPGRARSPRLQGTGLRTGLIAGSPLKQLAVVRNANGRNVTVQGRIPYTTEAGDEGFLPLPTLRLAPRELREIDLAATLRRSGIREVASAGLEFEHNGPPGTVLVKALAVSANGTHVFRVPLTDALLSSATGIYPWSLADGQSAVVYLKNVTDAPRNYTMHLDFDGGPYVIGLRTVPARQTVVIDLREIRDRQVPDVYGHTIPRRVTAGKAHWSMNGPEQHALVGRIEQVDLAGGMSSTAACGACCPNSLLDAFMTPSSVYGYPGGSQQFTIYTAETNCYGSVLPWYPTPAYFSSTNTSVATVTSGGLAQAVGPGETFIQSTIYGSDYYNCAGEAGNEEYCCDATDVIIPCESSCQVLPNVEIEVNKTLADNDDVVRVKSSLPTKRFKITSRARQIGGMSQAITVVLTNPDGRLRFPESADTTKTLTLPANGSWVEFEMSGETQSSAKDDAIIQAHCNSATGPVCGSEEATVFYFDTAMITVTQGGSYSFNPPQAGSKLYSSLPAQPAVTFEAKATLKPSGLDCASDPLKNLRVGISQNATSMRVATFINPSITWDPGVPAGTQVTAPTSVFFDISVPSFLIDTGAGAGPLYDDTAQAVAVPLGCTGGGSATSRDTPDQVVFLTYSADALNGAGTKVGTLTYTFSKLTLAESFRIWAVSYDTVSKEVIPLRESSWALNADSSAASAQKATPLGSDAAPTHAPIVSGTTINTALGTSTRRLGTTTTTFTR